MRVKPLALAVTSAFFSAGVGAQIASSTLPTGGQVAAGTATLTYSPNKLQIDQSSNKAILQWDSFSIGSSAWVKFSQPSASSVALNRVGGTNPSEIFGRLTSNGQVFLTNPNGVLFAPSASVDVGGLFATTLSIADRDFLAGRYNFYNAGGAGSVINQGVITATGYAALAGPQVRNDGIIVARAGTVALAAGDRVSLDMVGDGLIKVSVDQSALNASAINSGRIEADGGNVFLTARSANALLDTVVNNSGVIRANSLVARNGEIVLDGGSTGLVANTGTISVSGVDSGTTGGTVKILGDRVALLPGTQIDASGDSGGGTVLLGGNFHGSGPEQNASVTSVASGARINADAVNSGNGGRVVVWSNGDTLFAGTITARGGALSGNGGFIETSGRHLTIGHGAYVNASAAHGARGKWLLDPTDVDITDATAINTALGGGTDTVVTTDGNITVDDLVAWAGAATLTLTAGNDVIVNQTITGTGAGANVVLIADNDGTHSGTVVTNAAVSADNITIRYNPLANNYSSPTVFNATAASVLDTKMWVFVTADNKVYDATDVANLSLFGNAVANGALLTLGAGTFDTKNAGTGKTVTYSGQSLATGAAAFELFASAGTTTADVTPALLSINAVTDTKVYDATTGSGGAPTVSGLLGGDAVSGATQAYASKNVLGTSGSTLQVTAYTVNDGNSGNNYTVTTNSAAGTITPALLTLNAVTDTKVYDATTTSSATPTVSGLQGADSVSGRVQAYASKNVLGTNGSTLQVTAYTVNDGNSGNNYTVSASTAAGTITPASLTVNAVTDTKVYDATTSSTGVPTVGGLQGVDTVSGRAQAYASKNVLGTNGSTLQVTGYTVNDGNSGNNYTVTLSTTVGTITPASLTINAVTDTKVYDATTSSGGAPTVSGLLGGDALSGATQAYASKNVLGAGGSTLQVTGYTVNDGNSGNNYTISTSTAAGTITPASLTINAVSDTKVYDATTSSTSLPSVGGLQGADTVSAQAQAYASKNALGTNGSTLQVTAYAVNDGNLGNNYAVTTNTAAGTITPKALTAVSLTGTISKTYDGNASATLTPSNYTISGFVAGEGATVTDTVGSYGNGKDVQGPAAPVSSAVLTAGDYSAASGTLLSNYDFSAVTGVAATGNIGQITRLASVSAISNGLWSSASTWQGGAIPDKANVANVNLNGFAVTFDNRVGTNAGVTNLDSLTGGIAGSKLTFSSSNQLQVLNALNVQGYAQTAGTVATGTTFSVTNNFNQTGGTINSGAAVNIAQASGGLNAFSIAGSSTLTLAANNATGDIVLGSGAGLSGTTVTLAAGRNVSLNASVSGSTAVNVSFGQQVAGTFTPTATISGTTTVTGGAGADT